SSSVSYDALISYNLLILKFRLSHVVSRKWVLLSPLFIIVFIRFTDQIKGSAFCLIKDFSYIHTKYAKIKKYQPADKINGDHYTGPSLYRLSQKEVTHKQIKTIQK